MNTFSELTRTGRTFIVVYKLIHHNRVVELLDGPNLVAPAHWRPHLNEAAVRSFINDDAYREVGQLLLHCRAAYGFRLSVDRTIWIGPLVPTWHPAYAHFAQALHRSRGAPVYAHNGLDLSLDSPLSLHLNHP